MTTQPASVEPQEALPRWSVPLLIATSGGAILALTVLLLLDTSGPAIIVLQVVLLASFMALALVDLRAAVAIAMLELAIAGASGQWTRLPGGISGRVALDMIVAFAGVVWLLRSWRASGRLDLGRYGAHALAVALVLPGVWMPLGLLNGNQLSDVIADGNGHLFLAFALACVALMRQGHGRWLRRWFLVACVANALVTITLIAISVPGFVPLITLRGLLDDRLLVGNVIGYQPNGAYRLFLASGLYLQLGLALVTWRLLHRPSSKLDWALYTILWVDVVATYTRGFWIGALVAIAVVLIVGAPHWRRATIVLAGSAAISLASIAVGTPFNFSVVDYIGQRAATITATGQSPRPTPSSDGASDPNDDPDVSGTFSNQVRVHQAEVLLGHISKRPAFGFGFGSIAPDYRFAQIFSYELAYLDLLYKTGIVGLLIYLSFPIRLMIDAIRGRFGRLALPDGVLRRETAIVLSVIGSILLTGATNPYFLAAFGLMPILVMIAWLDPIRPDSEPGDAGV